MAAAIATERRMRLPVSAPAAVDRPRRVHLEAYQVYLRGRFFLNRRTGTALQKGVEHFQHAVALDPSYAQGYAGLADAYELAASYAGVMPRASIARVMAAARKALDLDPGLSEPHTSLGLIHGSYTWEWAESELAFKRAIALNASDALAHKGYGELLSFLGRHDDAITAARRAVTLDPLSLIMQANLGVTYYRARRYDEAARQMHDTLDLDPHYMLGHFNLGIILAPSGSYDEAALAFQRAQEYAPTSPMRLRSSDTPTAGWEERRRRERLSPSFDDDRRTSTCLLILERRFTWRLENGRRRSPTSNRRTTIEAGWSPC